MTAIIDTTEENTLETRLDAITAMLRTKSVDAGSLVRSETSNDLFIRNFLARNSTSIPDTSFMITRLRRVPPPQD